MGHGNKQKTFLSAGLRARHPAFIKAISRQWGRANMQKVTIVAVACAL
jgi:hypothetical protein